jgi:cell division control protein 6
MSILMLLSFTSTDKCHSILVLDELDHVASNPLSLGSLFSLSEKTSPSLRVIGIANTHTLTANSASSPIDPSKVQTLHFAPYTPVQLQEILRTRLSALYDEHEASPTEFNNIKKLLPNPSLVLLSKRIANMTGDVRSLFEVLRGAINLAVAAQAQSADGDILDGSVPSVTPQHILAALKAYAPANAKSSGASATAPTTASSNSEVVNKVRALGFQQRMALLTLLLASKRLEAGLNITNNLLSSPSKKSPSSPMKRTQSAPAVPSSAAVGIDTQQLYSFYANVLERSDLGAFDPVSRDDFGDLLNVLEGVGLVQLSSSLLATPSPKKRAFSRAASFGSGLGRKGAGSVGEVKLVEGVWGDEVLRGLGVSESASPIEGDLRNEEVKGLWLTETGKISKDVKTLAVARAANDKGRVLGFADASED